MAWSGSDCVVAGVEGGRCGYGGSAHDGAYMMGVFARVLTSPPRTRAREATPFAGDEDKRGHSKAPEPSRTVLATVTAQASDLRALALGLSWRGILTSAASDARRQRAAALLQPLIALLERQLFATETALRTQHSSF